MFGVISCNKGQDGGENGGGGAISLVSSVTFRYVGNDFHIVFGSVYGWISTRVPDHVHHIFNSRTDVM